MTSVKDLQVEEPLVPKRALDGEKGGRQQEQRSDPSYHSPHIENRGHC